MVEISSQPSTVPVSYFQVGLRTLADILKGQARMQRNRELGVGVWCVLFLRMCLQNLTQTHIPLGLE